MATQNRTSGSLHSMIIRILSNKMETNDTDDQLIRLDSFCRYVPRKNRKGEIVPPPANYNQLVDITRSTYRNWEKNGLAPKPKINTPGAVLYSKKDIMEFVRLGVDGWVQSQEKQ